MRTVIVFYSNTGHTRTVARMIADSIGCDYIELKEGQEYSASDFDIYSDFIIGSPAIYASLEPVVTEFMKKIDFRGRKVFPFITYGGISGFIKAEFLALTEPGQLKDMLKVCFVEDNFEKDKPKIPEWIEYVKRNTIYPF